jgi:hypothetical protein
MLSKYNWALIGWGKTTGNKFIESDKARLMDNLQQLKIPFCGAKFPDYKSTEFCHLANFQYHHKNRLIRQKLIKELKQVFQTHE